MNGLAEDGPGTCGGLRAPTAAPQDYTERLAAN
jgi:hypothetical protein